MSDVVERPRRRCAVVYNPTKIGEQFRDVVEEVVQRDGWVDTLWLETSADDPGRAMTRQAVSEHVDLVVGAGGDGTVRIVADGLAGTGIPMGLVPAGTANLLARNLALPMDERAAIEVAFGGHTRVIDLIKVTVDDKAPEHFAVLAGIGVDAMIMEETDPQLKDKVGSAAYFVAAGKALGRLPVQMTVRLDHHRPVKRHAMLCAVGNVGDLAGNLTLIPGAKPDDGLLDLYIASPRRLRHWFKLALRLIARRPKKDDQVDQHTGKRVEITLHGEDTYQLDGDVAGECSTLTAEIQPGALIISVQPADAATQAQATTVEGSQLPAPVDTAPPQLEVSDSDGHLTRRQRRKLRHGSYGLTPSITTVAGRPVRSLTAGVIDTLPEIVMVPGLGAPGYLAPWARESSAWTRTTVLDLPGWKGGRAASCPPTLDGVAVSTADWLEQTNRHDVILLGHSTGAQSVLRTALLVPDRVAGVVLAGPTFDRDARTVPALLRRLLTTVPREAPAELSTVGPSYLASGGLPLLRFLLSALPDQPEQLIVQLPMRALVITGERDGFAPPAWADRLAQLGSAPRQIIPGAHNACFPHPKEADTALRSWASQLRH
jgi:diacylglycerol kinase (ATP)